MEYRRLGNSGLRVSELSLGAWLTYGTAVTDEQQVLACVDTATKAGVNFIDTAEGYNSGKSEEVLGKVLKSLNLPRSYLVVSTKIYFGTGEPGPNAYGLSRKHIIEGLDASLRRLQLDYVDVVFAHRPDPFTAVEETVRAFNHVIAQGKAMYWGTSEWPAQRLQQAIDVANRLGLIGPIAEQPQYNMLHRYRVEKEYAPLYESHGLGLTVWSPLASGLLTGKYLDGYPADSRLAKMDAMRKEFEEGAGLNGLEMTDVNRINTCIRQLGPIAEQLNATRSQLALAWCLKNKHVSTVIMGASKPEQISENLKAVDIAKRMTSEHMEQIEKVLQNAPAPDFDWSQIARRKQEERLKSQSS